MPRPRVVSIALFLILLALLVPSAFAQQTGSVSGRVTASDGSALPGVTVEARSNVLPQARVTTSGVNGDYNIPALPPGNYTISFSLSGMAAQSRGATVYLDQQTRVDARMAMEGLSESVTVTADSSAIDTSSTEIKSALSNQVIEQLPVGQDYRDLVKLTPGVQHTENLVRGPSGGGSGQDNVYMFDGVSVNLPLFGTLSAEPASHDIDQISVIKGGARALDFNRAAGFTIDSVSKSGTNDFKGQLSYITQTDDMFADVTSASATVYDQERAWASLNFGGPILKEQLFFYGSYFRPETTRADRSNRYGPLPEFESTRDEYFGKLTYTPMSNILLHGSYRTSERENIGESVIGETSAGTTSEGAESNQDIAILEGSWVVSQRSFATFKITDYALETTGRPDIILPFSPVIDGSRVLDVANLDTQGFIVVPLNVSGQTAYNEFIAPIITRYGYDASPNCLGTVQPVNGKCGGGRVGVAREINDQDFFRENYQAGYNLQFGSAITHDLHLGYQWYTDEEDLVRVSNGWGTISVIGGRQSFQGQPIFYQAEFTRMSVAGSAVPMIHSEFESQNFEINDTIRWNNWEFNLGVLASQDTLYGQGLRENDSTVSGYEVAPGVQYEMHKIPFEDMIQPRLGITWDYNNRDNVYASYAKYYPAVNSLPRAASWDRGGLGLIYRANFDAQGNPIGVEPVNSSTGKLFADDLDPRYTDEYLIGTSRQITAGLSGRAYARYRYSTNFWEDTENNARLRWGPEGSNRELYIPNLVDQLKQLGISNANDSAFVIAEMDGAFTKYYEVSLESDWRRNNVFLRGTYTWSHYYGNFDQDSTTTLNDTNTFIGSSNIADGPGRQTWDNKYGDLRGDRRHLLKLYGTYSLAWNASIGAFALYQSGEPWETWSFEPYRNLPGFSGSSDVNRYAEPAGSRRGDGHYQLDMNYTQNIPIRGMNLQFALEAFNLTDTQTGFNIDPRLSAATYGRPQTFYAPRRYQVGVRFDF